MLSLEMFLRNIIANKLLKELEEKPDTLNLMNIGFSKDQIIDLINILRCNNNIKKLIYNAYLINKEKILLLANFLEEPECHITSIGFVNPYLMYYGQKNLYLILQKFSYIVKGVELR